MSAINEQFSDNPMTNIFGLVSGTPTETQFPSGTAKLLRFKADPNNNEVFKIGIWGTTAPSWPMSAGDDTGWFAPPTTDGNTRGLQDYSHSNVSGSAEQLHYWLQK